MAEEFDQYAVGWDAIADSNSDPADEASWVPVRSQQSDREVAERLVWQLRDVHANNPAVRNVGLFGRPTPPDWVSLDVGPRPLPDPIPPVEDQAVVTDDSASTDQPAEPAPEAVQTSGPPETADTPFEEPEFVPMDDSAPADGLEPQASDQQV